MHQIRLKKKKAAANFLIGKKWLIIILIPVHAKKMRHLRLNKFHYLQLRLYLFFFRFGS